MQHNDQRIKPAVSAKHVAALQHSDPSFYAL